MYKTKEDVMNRVLEHHHWAMDGGYEVVGTFLQGSWNYGDGLADEESDVDTKCLVLPTFEDFCLGRKMVSTTHVLDNDEHVDVKDLRLYMECFKKQNVNFVEILFTDYFVLNPKYEEIFQKMFDYRETIGRYDMRAALNCICGMAYEKEKALCHPYPATLDKIEKYGFDGKQLSHIMRLSDFMDKYLKGLPYKECLRSDRPQVLLDVKRNKGISLEEAKILASSLSNQLKEIKDNWLKEVSTIKLTKAEEVMNKVVIECMKTNFKSYLEGQNAE